MYRNEIDEFTNYISGILKREVNLPILSAQNVQNLNENELGLFVKQVVNVIREEYIKKQHLVKAEFQKRSKLLKQQENLQMDIVKDIREKIDVLSDKKNKISGLYENYNKKQEKIKNEYVLKVDLI